jgi:hypothetical protein
VKRPIGIILFISLLSLGCNTDSFIQMPGEADGRITAAYKAAAINLLASSYGKGLQLTGISSEEVNPDGSSPSWCYRYVPPPPLTISPVEYCFHATYYLVAFDSISPARVGAAIISHSWFDSDSALAIAERSGGTQFRSENLNCRIRASLGEPVVPNSPTYWWITYRANEDQSRALTLTIDANTGAISGRYP